MSLNGLRLLVSPAWRRGLGAAWLGASLVLLAGADWERVREELWNGQYARAVGLAAEEIKASRSSEELHLVMVEGLWTLGHYEAARTALTNALYAEPRSVRLRGLGRDVFLSLGLTNEAAEVTAEILELASTRSWAYRDAPNQVAVGRAALLHGADPRVVLEKLFDTARRADPERREGFLASGQLALDKGDFALAAKVFQEGLARHTNDADLHGGLARAYAPSDRARMLAEIEAALKRNSNHLSSLLLLADHRIDAEDYTAADALLERVLRVNPRHPEAWAYRAVLAHLRSKPDLEKTARATALQSWASNPRVDHLIGLKLSQKYRFAEGAAHQRQALAFDAGYLPAQAQLAQDLLRLGEDGEGWSLAARVHEKDGYDVTAFNLVTLRDTMSKYAVLSNADFVVRMNGREAAVYGPRVLDLLGRARAVLSARYGLEPARPVVVEIFAEQKDFGVRTFGMPDNPGFLGVCFGRVITANSPAANPGRAVNWEAVLWHEFCHVVTLQATHNKMPRWLSEGLSVYEELQANPGWGQHLNPRYREMLLGKERVPVAELSAAFLAPESDLHLQFAYFQSALVVEFLVRQFGQDCLKAILRDLGEGAEINAAIAAHTAPLAKLEEDFAAFARTRAEQLGPGLDWTRPDPGTGPEWLTKALAAATSGGKPNYYALTRQAREQIEKKEWAAAQTPLRTLRDQCPDLTGPDSAYALLAEAHRGLGETDAEREVLSQWAARDGEAPEAYLRLMELGTEAQDWPLVLTNALRYLAVNPLVPGPYRHWATAAERRGDLAQAVQAHQTLLQLDPPNPAEVHFNLARLMHRTGDPAARRQVLLALEEMPRHRAALQLLREIHGPPPPESTKP